MLNESIIEFVDQGLTELNNVSLPFWIKLFAIIGVVWVLNTVFKSGISFIHLIAYVVGFVKWVIHKILKKDI